MNKPKRFSIVAVVIIAGILALVGLYLIFKSHAATANADFNHDGVVNISDLSILAAHYSMTGMTQSQGDANGDGTVNILDLSVLASQWGNTTTASACPSTTPVPIATTANPQSIVDAHPSGTTYLIKTGIHSGFSITPQTGDTYCAEAGTILDGGGSTQFAFDGGNANNVTIIGAGGGTSLMEIRNYHPGNSNTDFKGAIENNSNNNQNWLIRYTNIHNNFPVGVTVGIGTQVRDNKIHDNTTLGISSGGNSNITIDHNEFYGNNSSLGVSCNFEAGGVKLSVGNHITYNNNYSHDNGCDGLWNDLGVHLNNPNATFNSITNNILIHNGGENHGSGEHYEISGGPCTISGNYVRGNNYDGQPFNSYDGGQIFISNSFGCDVSNNTVVGSEGIVMADDERSECSPSECPAAGNNVHDNNFYFNGTGLMVGGQCTDSTTCADMKNGVNGHAANIWQNNHYHMPSLGASVFNWVSGSSDTSMTKSQWQSLGFDTSGSFDTNTTPPAQPAWSL